MLPAIIRRGVEFLRSILLRIRPGPLEIARNVPGYSDKSREFAFKYLLTKYKPKPKRVLILGVYFGRDIVMMSHIMKEGMIVGVDKFSDDFCDDWPEDLKDKNWEDAGFGRAPDLASAQQYVQGWAHKKVKIQIIHQRDEDYLSACQEKFDMIYQDTSHDEMTVTRQIRQAIPLLTEGGILAGDDFSDADSWGVKSAVEKCLVQYEVLGGTVWYSASPKRRSHK
jgi:hypothetical protein